MLPLPDHYRVSREPFYVRSVAEHRHSETTVLPKHQHILLFNSALGCGGAERVMVTLANHWAARDRSISILTLHADSPDFFRLDERVTRRVLGRHWESTSIVDAIRNNVRCVSRLRAKIIESSPTVIISFQDKNNILVLLASIGLGIPVVISERNDPRQRPLPLAWRCLRRLLYRRASALVMQTESLREWARQLIPAARVYVIPNPVIPPTQVARDVGRQPNLIVAAGRLVPQKGFDLFLQALHRCKGSWEVVILGDGPERLNLQTLADRMNLGARVRFEGQVADPQSYFRRAGLFVLSSRYEGFPNVLVEAMACGLPAISFDCRSGPSEIIRHGVDGVLVPAENVEALATGIDSLMQDPGRRSMLASRAPDVIERFSINKTCLAWDSLIEATVGVSR